MHPFTAYFKDEIFMLKVYFSLINIIAKLYIDLHWHHRSILLSQLAVGLSASSDSNLQEDKAVLLRKKQGRDRARKQN